MNRNKLGQFIIGHQFWLENQHPKPWLGRHHTEKTKRKLSKLLKGNKNNLGKKLSEEAKKKISQIHKNRKFTEKHKKKLSKTKIGNRNAWKGGLTPESKRIRNSTKFRLWREVVFTRDNYTCWICGKRGRELHPHHLIRFSNLPALRFIVDNGITLCKLCHKTYTKFGATL